MKLLSLSTDPELSLLRRRVLETAGHEVVALTTEKEALEEVAGTTKFDVVLICHRLPDPTARKTHLQLPGHSRAAHAERLTATTMSCKVPSKP